MLIYKNGKMILKTFFFITVIATSVSAFYPQYSSLGTLYRWKQIDFVFPSATQRQRAIQNGQFNQTNVIPLSVGRWKDRLFITTPHWRRGVPASLSTVPVTPEQESPLLAPYPSWDWHTAGNCTGFTSLVRVRIDQCGVLWAVDSGQVGALDSPSQLCPPSLVAIDLKTDTVLGRFPIPSELILQDSLFANHIVDATDAQCRDLHVYIADSLRYGLLVFRAADASFWRFDHFTFFPEALLLNYTIHGINYQWNDGIFALSLGESYTGERLLYYNPLGGSRQFVVPVSVIQDPSRVDDSVNEFRLIGESRGPKGQVPTAATDRNGVMFFNLVSLDSVACWNTRKAYSQQNLQIIAHDSDSLFFPIDLQIDHEVRQFVWILSNGLPMYQFNVTDTNRFNYRVMYLEPNFAVQNTVCQN